MKIAVRVGLAVILLVATVTAADPPYVGKWKFNAAKSVLTGDTATIEQLPDGMMQFNSQGFVYKFRLDGKEYPTPDGATTSWTKTSDTVWDVTNRAGGKVLTTYHLVLKGEALAVSGKVMKSDGSAGDFTSTYKLVSGGPGFAGKWMSTEVKPPTLNLEISANAPDGVTLKDDTGNVFSGQFDGKDTPAQGRMAGSKFTTAFRKTGANAFELTVTLDGKPMFVEIYSVSADGKTLTDSGTPTNAKQETYKVVFDRQ